jgi:NitT/TauT family transport system permease protein
MTRPVSIALMPALVLALLFGGWEGLVRGLSIPPYILPAPSAVAAALVADAGILMPALAVTLRIAVAGFATAVVGGLALGILITRSRLAEAALSPLAVILQVMPLIAIAPVIVIYAGPAATVYLSAFIVAFFPVLAATAAGLKAVEPAHGDLFRLYRAKPGQRLAWLEAPTAVPYVVAGVRTAAGLSLVGAVVAEFVAGTGGAGSGLAYRLVEASYRLNVPRLFAAAVLICLTGVLIHALVGLASTALLRRWRPRADR